MVEHQEDEEEDIETESQKGKLISSADRDSGFLQEVTYEAHSSRVGIEYQTLCPEIASCRDDYAKTRSKCMLQISNEFVLYFL